MGGFFLLVCLGFCCCCVSGFFCIFLTRPQLKSSQVCCNTGTQNPPEDAPWAAMLLPSPRCPNFPAAPTHQSPPQQRPSLCCASPTQNPRRPLLAPPPQPRQRVPLAPGDTCRRVGAWVGTAGPPGHPISPPVTPVSPRSPRLSADPPALSAPSRSCPRPWC